MCSTLKTVILIFIGLVICALLTLHYLTKTRTKSLNDTEPFRPLIGKTVSTLRPVQVFRKKKTKNKDYPYDLYELGSGTRYPGSDGFEREPLDTVPQGAALRWEKAEIRHYGWGGDGAYCLLGSLRFEDTEYKVEYVWNDITGDPKGKKRFMQAPWQAIKDTTVYDVPYILY